MMKKYNPILLSLLLVVVALGFSSAYWWVISFFSSYEFYAYLNQHPWADIAVSLPVYIVPPVLLGIVAWHSGKRYKVVEVSMLRVVTVGLGATALVFFVMFSLLTFDPFLGIASAN